MSAIERVTAFLEARAAAEGPWDSDYVAGYTYHPLLASDLRELVELAGGGRDADYCSGCRAHADSQHAAGCEKDPDAGNPECSWCTTPARGVAIAPTEQSVPSCGHLGHGRQFTRSDGPWATEQPASPKFPSRLHHLEH